MECAVKNMGNYTYDDYVTWPDDERWEIINGRAYDMSPAPLIKHQNIVSNFLIQLKLSPKNPCYTGIAPTDVIFDKHNVVQPDVFVVCDKSKITEKNIQGAPDLIIEVLSSSTELKDRQEKKNLYEKYGVKEYVIVFTERNYIERYQLVNNTYSSGEIINSDEILQLASLDIEINLKEVFEM